MNQHKSIARRLLPLAVAALFCSLFFTLIQCQITIGSKQQELAAVREQLSAQQAKRDAVLAFRQEIQKEFEKILAADVGKALDQQTLARLIQAAVQGEDVSGYAVEVGQVTDGIRQQLAQELKNGLEIRPSKKVGAGFRLAAKDGSGYFDCSDQEIAEMLMPFFRDMHL